MVFWSMMKSDVPCQWKVSASPQVESPLKQCVWNSGHTPCGCAGFGELKSAKVTQVCPLPTVLPAATLNRLCGTGTGRNVATSPTVQLEHFTTKSSLLAL